VGWTPCPKFLRYADSFIGGLVFVLIKKRGFSIELSAPRQLSSAEMKMKVADLIFGRDVPLQLQRNSALQQRASELLAACTSHSAVIEFVDWYQRTDGGRFE
jgi:hypothetical protein